MWRDLMLTPLPLPALRSLGCVYFGGVFFFSLHHQLKLHIGSYLALCEQGT